MSAQADIEQVAKDGLRQFRLAVGSLQIDFHVGIVEPFEVIVTLQWRFPGECATVLPADAPFLHPPRPHAADIGHMEARFHNAVVTHFGAPEQFPAQPPFPGARGLRSASERSRRDNLEPPVLWVARNKRAAGFKRVVPVPAPAFFVLFRQRRQFGNAPRKTAQHFALSRRRHGRRVGGGLRHGCPDVGASEALR